MKKQERSTMFDPPNQQNIDLTAESSSVAPITVNGLRMKHCYNLGASVVDVEFSHPRTTIVGPCATARNFRYLSTF